MGCIKSKSKENREREDLCMLTNLSSEELKQAHDNFLKTSTSGNMSREQFEQFYSKISTVAQSNDFVDHLFRTFDFNNDGQINFREFICGLSVTTRGTPEEKLRWTFNVYDVNNDGTITFDEMKEIMRAIYAINGVTESEQQLSGEEAFQGLDVNGDGCITVAEFLRGVQKDERLLKMLERTIEPND